MKIKHVFIMVAIVAIALVATGCNSLQGLNGKSDAELLMPGNTLVTGECTAINRLSNGWVRVKINGNWYTCNEWRVVLKERD